MRAGRVIRQLEGYEAFIPAPLPPDPPLELGAADLKLLSDADRALAHISHELSAAACCAAC